jgi:hypothetical protein
MAFYMHNGIVYPPNAFIPAVERENPFDAIDAATAGLNACDFLLAEQRLRWLPLSDVAENR